MHAFFLSFFLSLSLSLSLSIAVCEEEELNNIFEDGLIFWDKKVTLDICTRIVLHFLATVRVCIPTNAVRVSDYYPPACGIMSLLPFVQLFAC